MQILLIILVMFFGSIIGSFLNVCIYRIPRKISIVFPSSFCPECKSSIPFFYNIPIFGYIILFGKCKFCGKKISLRYPLVEFLSGLFGVICFFSFPLPISLINFTFIATLIVISFIDLDFQIIPDVISIPAILLSAIFSFFLFNRSLLTILFGIIFGGGFFFVIGKVYELLTKREGLGFGDVKLMAFFGAYFGPKAIPFIVLMSSLVGTVVGLYLMIVKRKDSKYAIPFGPFLSLAAAVYMFWGEKIMNWYISHLIK